MVMATKSTDTAMGMRTVTKNMMEMNIMGITVTTIASCTNGIAGMKVICHRAWRSEMRYLRGLSANWWCEERSHRVCEGECILVRLKLSITCRRHLRDICIR